MIDWTKILGLIPQLQAAIVEVQTAVGVQAEVKAYGDLATVGVEFAEAVSGKALVNDASLIALVADVVKLIADAEALKPAPPVPPVPPVKPVKP